MLPSSSKFKSVQSKDETIILHQIDQKQTELSLCKFPQNEINTNVTVYHTVPMHCIVPISPPPYHISFNNGQKFKISKELHIFLALSNINNDKLFGTDLFSLFHDHFNRFNIISEINSHQQTCKLFAQLYWTDVERTRINKKVIITDDRNLLQKEYSAIKNAYKLLSINNEKKYTNDEQSFLWDRAQSDYGHVVFRFIATNSFYSSLHHKIISKNPQW
eukprot:67202_1